jgi:hypothetical protein
MTEHRSSNSLAQRLRNGLGYGHKMRHEAADAIDRLTAERDRLRDAAQCFHDAYCSTCPDGDCALGAALAGERTVAVAGDTLPTSLAQFYMRGQHLLAEEQEKVSPDNALVAFICDAIRLGRENERLALLGIHAAQTERDRLLEKLERLRLCARRRCEPCPYCVSVVRDALGW